MKTLTAVARPSLCFLALTFTFSWTVVIGGWALLGARAGPAPITLSMFGPAAAAFLCVQLFEAKGARSAALGLRFKPNLWWLLAWLLPLLLGLLSVGLTVLLSPHAYTDVREVVLAMAQQQGVPSDRLSSTPSTPLLLLAAAVLGGLINAVVLTFSEELGWRGYLHHLWRPGGFWRTSLATGAVWGAWHAPAILLFGHNYPDDRLLGAGLFIAFCMLLSPLLTLVRERGVSVWAAGIFHGVLNAIGGLTVLAVGGAAFPWNGIVGIGGFLALAIASLSVLALRPKTAQIA